MRNTPVWACCDNMDLSLGLNKIVSEGVLRIIRIIAKKGALVDLDACSETSIRLAGCRLDEAIAPRRAPEAGVVYGGSSWSRWTRGSRNDGVGLVLASS